MFERGLFSIFAGRVLAASFLAAGFAFLGANAAQAADPSFVGVLAYATDDAGARQLGLSDETRRALMELIEKREAEALELVLEIQSLPADQQQARLKPFREESERMGMALLSEAQRGLLKQMRLERVGLVALGEPEIAAKLQLTDEQRTAVTELLREREESMARATEQQRPKQVLYYERKLAEVITPEQLQAWEALARSAGDETPPTDQASPSPDAIAAQPPAATAPAATAPEPTTPAPSTDASPEPTKSAAVPSTRPTARVLPPRSTQPSPDGKVSFDFTFQPWKDVLNWIAQQADLSLVMDDTPPGTFNYRDDRRHTPDEAIDIVNTALLRKGYTLIRSGRMLMLVNIQNGIPSNLLPTVAPSELEERGKHELVSTVFAVNKLTPDEAEQVIRKLLGPQGEVVPLTQAKQLLVTETASRLITIRQVLDKAENPSGGSEGLRTFVLEHARPADVLATAKQLLDIPADRISNADSSLHITTDPAGRLVAGGKPEMVARLADMIKMLDVPGRAGSLADEQPQLEVYPISSADPTSALQIMQTLLAGMPDVRLTVDPKTGHLVALARPSQHATIRATLDQLQRDGRRLEVIPLRNADPQTAVLAINKLFGADGDNPSATAPRVEAEPTLRQLLVRGTASQVEQIKAMVQQMEGRDSSLASGQGSRGNLRLIPLSGRQTRSALEQIQAVWSATHTNPIRVVTPSNAIPEIRPNASDDSPESNPVLPPQTFPSQSSKQRAPQTPAPSPAPPASKSAQQKFRGFRVQFASQATEHGETAQQPDVQQQAIQLPGIQQNSIQQPAEVTPDANDETDDEIVDIPGAPIVVIPGPNGILIASDDRKALDAFEALLTTLTSQQFRGGREYTIFYLKYAKAVKVAELLDQIFGGGGGSSGGGGNLIGDLAGAALGGFGGGLMGDLLGGGGDDSGPAPVRGNSGPLYIVPDARLNALVVQGSPTDLDTIEHLLKVLDQANSPEEVTLVARPRLIPVVNTSAESIAEVVKQVYQDRMTSGQQRQPSPQEFFAALRGGRGGRNDQRRQDDAELQRLTIGVDTRNNSLVVSAADPLFNEVKALVEQLDQPSDESRETTRVVTLTNTNPDAVKSALVSVLGDQAITSTAANNNQRSRTSSQSSSSGQQTGGGDLGRQMQMFNALQGGGFGGGGWGRGGFGGGGGGWGRGGGGGRGGFGGGGRGGFGGGGGQGGGGGRGRN